MIPSETKIPDLDKINLTWIRKFLPVTAVIVGMRYNSQLIDEVIGVAQATFAPEAKLANRAITDDSGNEAKVNKTADNDKQQDAEKESSKDTDSKKDTAEEEKNNHQEADEKVVKKTQKDNNDNNDKQGSQNKSSDSKSNKTANKKSK